MRKRLLWIGGLVLALTVVALVVVVMTDWPPKPGVTLANFKRLHNGMDEIQIADVMGFKGQTHATGTDEWWMTWRGEDGCVTVEFAQGFVTEGRWVGNDGWQTPLRQNSPESSLDRFCRLLGLK